MFGGFRWGLLGLSILGIRQTKASLPAEPAQLVPLFLSQYHHLLSYPFEMMGKDASNRLPTCIRLVNYHEPSIFSTSLPKDKVLFHKIINYEGHIPAAFQDLGTYRLLKHWTKTVQSFQHRKLAQSKVMLGQMGVNLGADSLCRPHQLYVNTAAFPQLRLRVDINLIIHIGGDEDILKCSLFGQLP